MARWNTLCFVLNVVWFAGVLAQTGVGDSCTLNSGGQGICTPLDDCDLSLLSAEGKNPAVCSWEDDEAIACCPTGSPSPSRPKPVVAPTFTKATQKCQEYAKISCVSQGAVHTIVGGQSVNSTEEFPHMALLGYGDRNNPSWKCGGALISEKFVLSAAHCSGGRFGPIVAVNMGFLNLKKPNEFNTLQTFGVARFLRHPSHSVHFKYNDIALIELDRSVQFTSSVTPLCLNTQRDFPVSRAQATGWGHTAADNNVLSDNLMKVTLTLQSDADCKQTYNTQKLPDRKLRDGIKSDQQFCAGTPNKDTCQGDSGGPLQILDDNTCLHSIIGITSFGQSCGVVPGVYTRISNYVPWIESVVWP